jgi:DNA-binding transcriptional MerR regulator
MDKSPEAFRTISEVAEALDTPAHVLRFWESRFPQIRPVKRAGGRRYYRPSDIALLSGIKRLLHDEGLTIRGVQKILREQGIRHVARLGAPGGAPLPEDEGETIEAQLTAALGGDDTPSLPPPEAETAQIIALETVLARAERPAAPPSDTRQPGLFDDSAEAPEAPMVEVPDTDDDSAEQAGMPQQETAPDAAAEPANATVESDMPAAAPTLAARLRALPEGSVSPDDPRLSALRDRLRALRDRLAEASRRRAR